MSGVKPRRILPDGSGGIQVRPRIPPQFTRAEILAAKQGLLKRDFNHLSADVDVTLDRSKIHISKPGAVGNRQRMDFKLDDDTRDQIEKHQFNLYFERREALKGMSFVERDAFKELERDGRIKTGVQLNVAFKESAGRILDLTQAHSRVHSRGATSHLSNDEAAAVENTNTGGFTLKIGM